VIEKRGYFRRSELTGMPLASEKNEAPHPMKICFFGAVAVVPPPNRLAGQFKQLRAPGANRDTLRIVAIHVRSTAHWKLRESPAGCNVLLSGEMTGEG